MLLLIDNFDSFTFNLARYFIELGQEVEVRRNDKIDCEQIQELNPDYLVFSPGPCTPDTAGITLDAIQHFAGKIPILGVCLGHQAIGQTFGAKVIGAQQIKHGKTSQIYHSDSALFTEVPSPFVATRYHSLVLDRATVPHGFNITAWSITDTEDNDKTEQYQEVMAIENKKLALYGVQFHPESLLTEFGHTILQNFLRYSL